MKDPLCTCGHQRGKHKRIGLYDHACSLWHTTRSSSSAARTREPVLARALRDVLTILADAGRDGWASDAGRRLNEMILDAMQAAERNVKP